MSSSGPRGHGARGAGRAPTGGPQPGSGPAPADALVAVVERHGRFLTAEPLFPPRERDRDGRPQRRNTAARLTLGPARGGRGARIDVSAGQLVLVQRAGRGAGAAARVLRVLGRPDVARDVIEALLLDRGLARGFDAALRTRSAQRRRARRPANPASDATCGDCPR